MHRKNAAQLWKKCPSCQRELFSEDHFCTSCGQCLDCCQGTHAIHNLRRLPTKAAIGISEYGNPLIKKTNIPLSG